MHRVRSLKVVSIVQKLLPPKPKDFFSEPTGFFIEIYQCNHMHIRGGPLIPGRLISVLLDGTKKL